MQKEFNIQVPEFCHGKECEGSWFPVKIFEVSSSRCSDRAVWLASDTWWCTGPNLHFSLQKIMGGPWNDHTSDKVSHNWDGGGGEHHGFYWGITFWITIHLLIPPKNIRCSFWGVDSTPLVCCGREPRSMSSTTDSLGESSSSRSSRWVLWGDVGGWQWSCCRNWRKWLVRQWDLQESPPWIMRLKQEMQRSQIRPCCFWWMQSHFVDGRNWRVL